jgi:hypothetical protein
MPCIAVILVSARLGRFADKPAVWVVDRFPVQPFDIAPPVHSSATIQLRRSLGSASASIRLTVSLC